MPSSPLPPYLTAGASSRAHHALLVRVQDATPQEGDRIISDEIARIKASLDGASPAKVAEMLIILLHISILRRTTESLDFALIKAIELAGGRGKEKRIGYLYIVEMMPREHPLGLLLINTIRKDLSSDYAVLALKTIVQLPLADISPAVTPLLISKALLKHKEPAIRQRTIQALSKLHLASTPSSFPISMSKVVRLITTEEDPSVLCVLLKLVERMIQVGAHVVQSQEREYILQEIISAAKRVPSSSILQIAVLRALKFVLRGGMEGSIMVEDYIIGQLRLDRWGKAHVLEACHLGTSCNLPNLINANFRLVSQLLSNPTPNDHILALRSLWILSEQVWQGRVGEDEMCKIMEGINSPDDTIRVVTLELIHMADQNLTLRTYESLLEALQSCEDLRLPLHLADEVDLEEKTRAGLDETASRALEVAEVRTISRVARESNGEPGEAFARAVKEILVARDERRIWQSGLQRILDIVRRNKRVSPGFTDTLLGDYAPDSTLLVLRTSLICEYGTSDAGAAWEGFKQDLEEARTGSSERELIYVSLVPLLAGTVDSDDFGRGVLTVLRREQGSKYLLKRRDQVVIVLEHNLAQKVMDQASSRALPDILNAIIAVSDEFASSKNAAPSSSDLVSPVKSPLPKAPSDLRYDAYESPNPRASMYVSPQGARASTPSRQSRGRRTTPKDREDTVLFDQASSDVSRDEVSGLLDMSALSLGGGTGRNRSVSSPFFDHDQETG